MSRARLLEAAVSSVRLGLNHGATGNLSERSGPGMLITPSAVPYHRLQDRDLVQVTFDGTAEQRQQRPSSEWRLHADIYRARPEVHAIVHAHPPFATTIACLREDLPAVHYMIAVAGGDRVSCSRYALFGTTELSAATLEALADRKACLLANHGLVAVGSDLDDALGVALEIEAVAEYWCRGRAIGKPVLLTSDQMAAARSRFSTYR